MNRDLAAVFVSAICAITAAVGSRQSPQSGVLNPLAIVLHVKPPIVPKGFPPSYLRRSFADGVDELFNAAHVPGGTAIFLQSGQSMFEGPTFPPPTTDGVTLGLALRRWLAKDPQYTIHVDGRAVDVLPRKIPPLLLTQIAKFDYSGSPYGAVNALIKTPEFKQAFARLGLHWGVQVDNGGISATPPPPIEIRLKSVTLLQALNAVAVARGAGTWDYMQRDKTDLMIR